MYAKTSFLFVVKALASKNRRDVKTLTLAQHRLRESGDIGLGLLQLAGLYVNPTSFEKFAAIELGAVRVNLQNGRSWDDSRRSEFCFRNPAYGV